jgi:uracil-DNA glycosylase
MSEAARFREIFRAAHASHAACSGDEWLHHACRNLDGTPAERPIVWSRRNGPWRRVDLLWVGAAPGNAGGLGRGALGAHATRIPFGGDIAGGNLDVLLGAAGVHRNDTYVVASLNQLPLKGGGEPSTAELAAPVGHYPNSAALLRDTIIASGPRLVICLGNVALRTTVAALTQEWDATTARPARAASPPPLRLPGPAALAKAGFVRGVVWEWPDEGISAAATFQREWHTAWRDDPFPALLPVLHPSAQNMSPFAGPTTVFHTRMLQTRDAVRQGVAQVLGRSVGGERPPLPRDGIYALPEWRRLVGPAHARYDELWRALGV